MRLETTATGAVVRRLSLWPCVLEDTFKGQNKQQDEERTARSLIEHDRPPAAARARPPKISAARKAVRAARRPAAPHLTTAAPGRSADVLPLRFLLGDGVVVSPRTEAVGVSVEDKSPSPGRRC